MTIHRIRPFAVDQDHGRFTFPQTLSVSGAFVREGAVPGADPQIAAYYAGAAGTPYFKASDGTVLDLSDTGPYPPLVGVLVLDDGVFLGTGTVLDFGDNLDLSISGSSIRIDGQAGGDGHATGTMVIYDEDSFVGVFEEMRFYGAGVNVLNSGSFVGVEIEGGGAGASDFLGLDDTPSSYSGQAGLAAVVNSGETALEFADLSPGNIIGEIQNVEISGGKITITPDLTKIIPVVITGEGEASDDLDDIAGGQHGQILILMTANSAWNVTVRDQAGSTGTKFQIAGSFTLDTIADMLVVMHFGDRFGNSPWVELARANNA